MKLKTTALCASIALLSSTASFAQEKQSNGFYVGLQAGKVDVDVNEPGVDVDDGDAIGLTLGYVPDMWGAEIQLTNSDIDITVDGETVESDYKTVAAYAVFRTRGDAYFKARAGLLREEIETNFASETDTGFSAGIGAGVRVSIINLEAEFTVLEEDANLFSIGASINF